MHISPEQDPAGFTKRLPEFAKLLKDPEIADAVRTGDPFKVYRALHALKKAGPHPGDIELVDSLCASRRFFLKPISSAPGLFRINGVGAGIYGKSEEDPKDGTYITTYCLSFVWIPVFPLSQYLVRPAGGQKYSFFGKVPPSPSLSLWRKAVTGIAAAAILAFGAASFQAHRTAMVHVVNGLDVPVQVSLAGQSITVGPNEHQAQRVDTGDYDVAVKTVDGQELERQHVSVPGWEDVVAYNVLGAAPLYAEEIVYTSSSTPSLAPSEQRLDVFAGQRLIARSPVSYAFADPPKEIEMQGVSESRWHFDVAQGGWKSSVLLLTHQKNFERAADVATAVATVEPEAQNVELAAGLLQHAHGLEAAIGFLKGFLEKYPKMVEAHRMYQSLLLAAGREDEAKKTYRALYEKEPDSPAAAYLFARLQPPEEAVPLLANLVIKYPDEPHLAISYGWHLYADRRFRDALPHFERAAELAPDLHGDFADGHAQALVALGRTADALRLVEEVKPTSTLDSLSRAILYARLSKLAGRKAPHPPDYLLNLEDYPGSRRQETQLQYAAALGDPVEPKDLAAVEDAESRAALELALAIPQDPTKAFALAKAAPESTVRRVDRAALFLLACEAARQHEEAVLDSVMKAMGELAPKRAALEKYLATGEGFPERADLDLSWQAALEWVRSRALTAQGASGAEPLRLAQADDLLKGVVSRAIERWPRAR